MPPKPAPRLVTPAEPHYQNRRPITNILLLVVLPLMTLGALTYSLLHPPRAPPAASPPAPIVWEKAPPEPPLPPTPLPSAEERVAAAVALAQTRREKSAPIAPPVVAPTAALHYSEPVSAGEDTLDNYPLANPAWAGILNPSKQSPASGYNAYYLDTAKPRHQQLVRRANVRDIAVEYSWSDFHNIPSEQFAAYWVGRLRVPETGMYQIKGKLNWANVRVMLDRHIILDAKNSLNSKTFRLKKGEYLLEVEYENHWHTTKFHLNIAPVPILRSP